MTGQNKMWVWGPNENAKHCAPGKRYNPVTKRCKIRRLPALRNICPSGKVLNSKTRRFRKERVAKPTKVCPSGKYLDNKTGRFRKVKNTKNSKSRKSSKNSKNRQRGGHDAATYCRNGGTCKGGVAGVWNGATCVCPPA